MGARREQALLTRAPRAQAPVARPALTALTAAEQRRAAEVGQQPGTIAAVRVSRRRIAEVSFLLRALVEELAAAGGLGGRVHREALDVVDAFARGETPSPESLATARAAVAKAVGRIGMGSAPLHVALSYVPMELLFGMVESGDDLSAHIAGHAAHVLRTAGTAGDVDARVQALSAEAAARAASFDDAPQEPPAGESVVGGLEVDLPALALVHLAARGAERSGKHGSAKATRALLAAGSRAASRAILAFEAAYGGLELHEGSEPAALVVGPYALGAAALGMHDVLVPVAMASDDVCYALDAKGRGFTCARMVEGVFRPSAANGRALLAQAVLWRALVTHPGSFVTRDGLHGEAMAAARGAPAIEDASGPTERWWGRAEGMALVAEIDHGNGFQGPRTYATG